MFVETRTDQLLTSDLLFLFPENVQETLLQLLMVQAQSSLSRSS